MAGSLADHVGLHTDLASGAMDLVVQPAVIERVYECSCVWLVKKRTYAPHTVFPSSSSYKKVWQACGSCSAAHCLHSGTWHMCENESNTREPPAMFLMISHCPTGMLLTKQDCNDCYRTTYVPFQRAGSP